MEDDKELQRGRNVICEGLDCILSAVIARLSIKKGEEKKEDKDYENKMVKTYQTK